MPNPGNNLLAELTQLFADIDETIPQYQEYADHHKALVVGGQAEFAPALAVIEGAITFIMQDIDRAREGDVLAALQVAHFLTTISTAISIFSANPAHQLAAVSGIHSELIRQSLAKNLTGG